MLFRSEGVLLDRWRISCSGISAGSMTERFEIATEVLDGGDEMNALFK